jgi:hypothetical protein
MTDLYNDVNVLGDIMSNLLSNDVASARSKLQTLLTEKGRELTSMETYFEDLANEYEYAIVEEQAA